MATPEDIKDSIAQQVADGVRRVTGDTGSTEMHDLTEQIEAAKFVGSSEAIARPQAGIRLMKFRPGGAP